MSRRRFRGLRFHGVPYVSPGRPAHRRRHAQTRQRNRSRALNVSRGRLYQGYQRTGGYYGMGKDELKFKDTDLDDALIATAGGITDSINKIAQGTTESTRIGRKCVIKSIMWRWSITLPTTATAIETSDIVRVILYLDKQCNGATATVTDILESADFQSFNNLANKGRFRTLMDRSYNMNSPSGSGRGTTDTLSYGDHVISDQFYKKVTIPVEFDNTAGAITEIRSNNIGILLISGGGYCAFASKFRLRFSDS